MLSKEKASKGVILFIADEEKIVNTALGAVRNTARDEFNLIKNNDELNFL
jgi:aspartyl-tRNA synthetase